VHRVLVGKPVGKRPLGRPRCRWEDNIKMDSQEVGGGRGDWMEFGFHKMRGISWLAATTGQLLKKDSAPWSKQVSIVIPT
jgi:hypothetical protein